MNINVVEDFPKGKRCVALWIFKGKIQSDTYDEEGYLLDLYGGQTAKQFYWGEYDDAIDFIGFIILED